MIYDHYGYQPLPQHAGLWFFKEQLAHLEIALAQNAKSGSKPRTAAIEEILFEFLSNQDGFLNYSQLSEGVGRSRKVVTEAILRMKRKGVQFEWNRDKKGYSVRMK